MKRRPLRALAVIALVGYTAVTAATPAEACTASMPPVPAAARTAEYIVVGRLTSRSANGRTVTLVIERTLKGNVSGTLRIGPLRNADRCHLGGYGEIDAPTGSAVIFAHGFTWHGRTYDGYTAFGDGAGTSLFVNKGETVDSVVRQIVGALPPTYTLPTATAETPAGPGLLGGAGIALAALAAALAFEFRRRQRLAPAA